MLFHFGRMYSFRNRCCYLNCYCNQKIFHFGRVLRILCSHSLPRCWIGFPFGVDVHQVCLHHCDSHTNIEGQNQPQPIVQHNLPTASEGMPSGGTQQPVDDGSGNNNDEQEWDTNIVTSLRVPSGEETGDPVQSSNEQRHDATPRTARRSSILLANLDIKLYTLP